MPNKCGNCKKVGHNKITCKFRRASTSGSENSEPEKTKVAETSEDPKTLKVPLKRQDRDRTESPKKTNPTEEVQSAAQLLTDFDQISQDSDSEQEQNSSNGCVNFIRKLPNLKGNSKTIATADWKIGINRPKKLHSNIYIRDTNEVLIRILQGPTNKDGPGYIYMYKIDERFKNVEIKEELQACYKIGMSDKPPKSRRIPAQETANQENYEVVNYVPVAWRKLTEKVIHLQLNDRHYPRNVKDGGTEWFKGDLESETGMDQKQKIHRIEKKLKEVILDAKNIVQSKWGGEEPKEGL